MLKKVLVAIADGLEEIEAITIIDVLRRSGVEVTIASVNGLSIVAAHGLKCEADVSIDECQSETYDLIVLPGGMPGAENLSNSDVLVNMLHAQEKAKRFIAAICASPMVVFEKHGIVKSYKKTCYPSMLAKLSNGVDKPVVVDNFCITSQGPGTAMAFALKLVELLVGKRKANELSEDMLIKL